MHTLAQVLKSIIRAPFDLRLYWMPRHEDASLPKELSVIQTWKWSEVPTAYRRMLLDYEGIFQYLRFAGWVLTKRACFLLVRYKGHPAHITVLLAKPGAYKRKFRMLSNSFAIIGPCYTLKDFRGIGIYPALIRYSGSLINFRWRQEAYICTDVLNYSSIRGIEKAQCQLLGRFKGTRYFMFWIRSKKVE
jgi:hypothetical protein